MRALHHVLATIWTPVWAVRFVQNPHGSQMSLHSCLGVFFIAACACAPALAAESVPARTAAGKPAQGACALQGAGFVNVPGADTCVKIGGHVRVEYGVTNRPGSLSWGRDGGAAPAYAPNSYAPTPTQNFGPLPASNFNASPQSQTGAINTRSYVRVKTAPGQGAPGNPAFR